MAIGRRGKGAPYPNDIALDGIGLMLSRTRQGRLDWTAEVERVPGPEREGAQRQVFRHDDFTGGFGSMRDNGSPETRRDLYFSRAVETDPDGNPSRYRTATGGVIDTLTDWISCPAAVFTDVDIGHRIEIVGAGVAGGVHVARIVAVTPTSAAQFDPAVSVALPLGGLTVSVWIRDPVGGGVDPRFGGLMRGPRVRGPQRIANPADGNGADIAIRKLVAFTPTGGVTTFVAACGRRIITSTDPDDWTANTIYWVSPTADGNIVDLKVFGARKGGPELEIATDTGPRYFTYTLDPLIPPTQDGPRKSHPQAVYFWDYVDNQYWDITAILTDDNDKTGTPETAAEDSSISEFHVVGTATGTQVDDHILFGFRHPFDVLDLKFGKRANGDPSLMELSYRSATGWEVMTTTAADPPPSGNFHDGTLSSTGVATFQHSGLVKFTVPASPEWVPTVLNTSAQSEPLYFVRFRTLGAAGEKFDGSVNLLDAKVQWRIRADAFAVSGTNLAMVVEGSTLITTPSGGAEGVIYETSGPFAIPAERGAAFAGQSGGMIRALNLAGTIYVVKSNGVFSVTADGVPTELAPAMAEQPAAEPGQGVTVWNNRLYVAHDWQMLQVTPQGEVQAIGPERLTLGNQALQFRATALVGHALHFLYGAFVGSDGNSYLGTYGVYRQVVDAQTQVEKWDRMDIWAMVGALGNRRIRSMEVFFGSDRQPHLLMGSMDGELLYGSLPKAFHPLDAHSGYQWSDVDGEGLLPSFDGHDSDRTVVAYRSTFRTRRCTALRTVELWSRGGAVDDDATDWVLRCVVDNPDQSGFSDLPFETVHDAHGFNVKLVLKGPPSDHDHSVILDVFSPWYRQPLLGNQRQWTFNVQAHDRVLNLQGRRVPYTAAAWERLVRGWAGDGDILTLVTPTGEVRRVMVDGVSEIVARPNPQAPPQLAYALSVSSAE